MTDRSPHDAYADQLGEEALATHIYRTVHCASLDQSGTYSQHSFMKPGFLAHAVPHPRFEMEFAGTGARAVPLAVRLDSEPQTM